MPDDGSPFPIYSPHRWAGPVCWLAGLALLGAQAALWFNAGILDSWLIGTGVALILCANAMLYWTITDRRSKQPPEEDITAEEYDAMIDEVDMLPPHDEQE